ncbi:uncharacterized protein LOC130665565 [Microplitis mediator]|nr:uncharacterized protein LOC130665565 [Microplitis mediator]
MPENINTLALSTLDTQKTVVDANESLPGLSDELQINKNKNTIDAQTTVTNVDELVLDPTDNLQMTLNENIFDTQNTVIAPNKFVLDTTDNIQMPENINTLALSTLDTQKTVVDANESLPGLSDELQINKNKNTIDAQTALIDVNDLLQDSTNNLNITENENTAVAQNTSVDIIDYSSTYKQEVTIFNNETQAFEKIDLIVIKNTENYNNQSVTETCGLTYENEDSQIDHMRNLYVSNTECSWSNIEELNNVDLEYGKVDENYNVQDEVNSTDLHIPIKKITNERQHPSSPTSLASFPNDNDKEPPENTECDYESDADSRWSDIEELNNLDLVNDEVRDDSCIEDIVGNINLTLDKSCHWRNSEVNDENQMTTVIDERRELNVTSSSIDPNETLDRSSVNNSADESYVPIPDESASENEINDANNASDSLLPLPQDTTELEFEPQFNAGAPDVANMFVVPSGVMKRKSHFCFYCKTWQRVISRHLQDLHREEDLVKSIIILPKGPEKNHKLELLRLKGDNLFTSCTQYNDGEKMVVRQPNSKMKRTAADFKTCHVCLGEYASIHRHRRRCVGGTYFRHRANPILSRGAAGLIHESATPLLRKLFSVMHDDDVSRVIRYDDLLIYFANLLCDKYSKQQQHDMIRSRLRLLGKLVIEMKGIEGIGSQIIDFSSIINPKFYSHLIESIKRLTGCDAENKTCRAPSAAITYGTYLGKVTNAFRSKCIEDENHEPLQRIKYFEFLHKSKYPICINNLAYEELTKRKRHKQVELPIMDDIKIFREHLENKFQSALVKLKTEYSYLCWKSLSETTLVLLLLFNRKRPGELERASIEDYRSAKKFSESNKQEYEKLSENDKKMVDNYLRFELGGKLDRNVPVIVWKEGQESIEMILKYRREAGIHEKNPFIFALPGFDNCARHRHLQACQLIREYASESDASHPETLRATNLRKHFATTVASLKIAESEIYDIANFMGHDEQIHRHHYRQTTLSRDLCGVSKILEVAVGMKSNHTSTNATIVASPSVAPTILSSNNLSSEKDTQNTLNNEEMIDNDLTTTDDNQISYGNVQHEDLELAKDLDSCDSDFENEPKKKKSKQNFKKKKTVDFTDKKRGKFTEKYRHNPPTPGTSNLKTTRKRWRDDELLSVKSVFAKNIETMKLPTAIEIRQFLSSHPKIDRTEAQIRSWICNQYMHEKKKLR